MLYWFTVDPELPDVLDVGIRNGIWGVPDGERERIEELEPGDGLLFFQRDHGFVLCEVESEPYTETVPVWSEVDYPHRVRISDPRETDRYAHLAEVHDCLRDPETGERFSSTSNAAAALESEAGRMRPLSVPEIRCLFRRLGWILPAGVSPAPEAATEGTEGGEGGPAAGHGEAGADRAGDEGEEGRPPDEEEPDAPPPDEEEPAEASPVTEVPKPAMAEPVTAADDSVAPSSGDEEPAGGGPVPAEPAGPDRPRRREAAGPRVLVVAAAEGTESRRRWDETAAPGVDLGLLEDDLADRELAALRARGARGRAHVWGAPAAGDGEEGEAPDAWARAATGDVVLASDAERVFASARVLLTRRDPDLARKLWGGDGSAVPGCLVFLDEPAPQDVARDDLDLPSAEGSGDSEAGLTMLDGPDSLRVLGAFPELGLTPADDGEVRTAAGEGGMLQGDGEGAPTGEARLRTLLFGPRELGRCGLCGVLLPVDLLAVIHPKPLDACTEEELDDVGNNVLPACRMGCAGLFREGYLVVDDGRVEAGARDRVTDTVADRVEAVTGNHCAYWHAGSEPYFRWHAGRTGGGEDG